MDFLVDAVIRYVEFYTLGMLAIPLFFLGWAIKLLYGWHTSKESGQAGLGIASLVAALISAGAAVPPYMQARKECEELQAQRTSLAPGEGLKLVNGEFQIDLQASLAADLEYFSRQCDRLLTLP